MREFLNGFRYAFTGLSLAWKRGMMFRLFRPSLFEIILLSGLAGLTIVAYLNPLNSFDVQFAHYMYSLRTADMLSFFSFVTHFGNGLIVIILAVLLAGIMYFFYTRATLYAKGLLISVVGALGTVYMLKLLIARARPESSVAPLLETSFSFPSGHAAGAMALYGFIAFILCRMYPRHKNIVIVAASVIILGIGFGRLYLGVHFPSDVVAGYLVAALWLIASIKIARMNWFIR